MELELPQGRSLESMEDVVAGIEDFMSEKLKVAAGAEAEGVTSWVSYIGNGGVRFVLTHTPKPKSPGYAMLVVNTTSAEVIDAVTQTLEEFIRASYPDVSSKMKKIETSAP
jgi:multidrug efflux pump subunit AcrB